MKFSVGRGGFGIFVSKSILMIKLIVKGILLIGSVEILTNLCNSSSSLIQRFKI